MKKLILTVIAVGFIFGCGESTPPAPQEDPAAELQKTVAGYSGACADIEFQDTRNELSTVFSLRESGQSAEAEEAYGRARDYYEAALPRYEKSQSDSDAAKAEISDQKSRLEDIRADGMQHVPQQYAATESNINRLHTSASEKLDSCDIAGAQRDIDQAEDALRMLEDSVSKMMMAKPAPVQGDVYTVKKGDCLWKIAAAKYADPYFWPLIYWTNKSSIKDPDLIYPDQKLNIDQGYGDADKTKASKFAKTRGPWSLYDKK